MRTLLLGFCLVLACGDKDEPADDSGTAVTDGGATDGGTAGTDGGATDGGTASTDGGTAGTDGGTAGTDGGTTSTDGGTPDGGTTALAMADFALPDLNPGSPRYGETVSPRDYLEQVSGWYFTHAT